MDPLPGVEILQGDFREDDVLAALVEILQGAPVDLVMSDMAPNISGMDAVDQPRAMYLVELAADFAAKVLGRGGDLLFKAFQGEGFDDLIRDLRSQYRKVVIRKPRASRPRSREVYVLAKGRINGNMS
jgi:23S rRNA (uridine2552-2'-O)-methyltransferase